MDPGAVVIAAALLACEGEPAPLAPADWAFEPVGVVAYPPVVTDLFFHDDALVVADKGGEIVRYSASGERTGAFSVDVHDVTDCGLISMAPAPDFAESGLLYFGACESTTASGVFRVTVDWDTFTATDRVTILLVEEPTAPEPWHNVGWIGFDAEGALLALFGEKTRSAGAQEIDNLLGSVARILPSAAPGEGGYAIPTDNPPWADPDAHPALFAHGLRSPWTGALDSDGRLWVADVGSAEKGFEELDLVLPGANLGWPEQEGPCGEACGTSVGPVSAYPHDLLSDHPYFSEDPRAVPTPLRVGWVAPAHPGVGPDPYGGRLSGRLLFGDACMGFVRAVQPDAAGALAEDVFLAHLEGITAWDVGWDGYLYASRIALCISDPPQEDVSGLYRLLPPE